MKSNNDKPKIFSDGFTGTLAIIGGISGTIIFVVNVFGEWYADFDIEPVGIITGILTIALFLLPFAISILLGGGIGLLVGGFLGIFIEFIVNSVVSFVRSMIESCRKKKAQRKASQRIKKANQYISKDIESLEKLKKELPRKDEVIVSNYNLCLLLEQMLENDTAITKCNTYCKEQYEGLLKIRVLEERIEALAMQYETIGDITNAAFYRSFIK